MKIGIRIENFAPEIEPRVALPYPKIREIAQMAEMGGLDSIWLSDHLFYRFEPNVRRSHGINDPTDAVVRAD